MAGGWDWTGIPSDRVVAVVAHLDTGRVQIGSGYLVAERLVLTARHCTLDNKTGRPAKLLRVTRRSDGVNMPVSLIAAALDVAVLRVAANAPWVPPIASEPPRFGKVDRNRSRQLHGCQAVGFPLWQLDPRDQQRNAAELHGSIRATEDIESGLMVMRDPLLSDVAVPDTVHREDQTERSPWGGLSGALVFYHGMALGLVIEHHPRQGPAAITILPAERFAAPPADGDPDLLKLTAVLGLPPAEELPLADGPPLAGLVDVLVHGQLPRVARLDPYTLGATPSAFGNPATYGQHDQYVFRNKEEQLSDALLPGRLVLLIGPAKAGKTRTTFEVLRRHDRWNDAVLVAPTPESLDQLAGSPALSVACLLVIWLDGLHRFLPPAGKLSQGTISRLLDRSGPTILLGTLRSEQRDLLREPGGELTREARMVLDLAITIEDFGSTKDDPGEQARAAAAYPGVDLRKDGLAEMLAGAPELLCRYRDAQAANPLLHALVQTCIDWARCGFARPIPEQDLFALTWQVLEKNRPDLDPSVDDLGGTLRWARKGIAGGGQVALLRTHWLPGRSRRHVWTRRLTGRLRGYEAFEYLIAADDGEVDEGARPVDEATWQSFLERANDEDAYHIGVAAYQRGNATVAVAATRRAAKAGHADAMNNLGLLLLQDLDPRDLAGARTWLTKAAEAGHTYAPYNLGVLFAERIDPPDLAAARTWYTKAAKAGHADAMNNLGALFCNLDPPDLEGARTWWTKAAEAGNANAPYNLGVLFAVRLDPPDLAAARTWYTKAAKAGHADAMNNLGALFRNLDPPDLEGARTWWTKAAEAGHTKAQYNLGVLLAVRLDPPDLAGARTWYTKAAEADDADAQYNLAVLLQNLDPPDLEGARTWYTKAAEAGHTKAQYGLGVLLAVRLDPPDLAGARTWYTKAAEADDADAQYNLAVLLDNLDPPDLEGARTWYTKAAEAGHTKAQYGLGVLLDNLDPPDLEGARTWYTKAAEAGHTYAQCNLGMLLAEMDPPDLAGARTWWTKAAEAGDTDAQYNLGVLLAEMDPPDLAGARTWWTKAAEAGDTDALNALE